MTYSPAMTLPLFGLAAPHHNQLFTLILYLIPINISSHLS
ncbi:hypothetical protein PPEP_a2814 [Pseudoalteromonas peptidolytica F12-50-A1]|uniref:Uncharacterized protein n=1 Tax=Pseudoalteromonas peptidolytica F12-50-A1 TaxID=1315280 RepID=A0A8I0T475_9GAMM|nr:hypothetical protein [Pseudoalteromonas peptidolytica F12-50-A1]